MEINSVFWFILSNNFAWILALLSYALLKERTNNKKLLLSLKTKNKTIEKSDSK